MEIRNQERENSTATSPRNNGGGGCSTTAPPTPTPKPIFRSDENNPYPTTFIQADTSSFKQVVQMLTGSTSSKSDPARTNTIPPIKPSAGQTKKQGFKLYERRNSLKNCLMINTLMPGGFSQNSSFSSPRKPEILSPSILDFPALVLSPVTPMNTDTVGKSSESEEKAIAEKKFYLLPSPRTTEPKLLPLFPVTSPLLLDQN